MGTQLSFPATGVRNNPGKLAPLLHKWFARRRPEATEFVLDQLEEMVGHQPFHVLDPFMGSGTLLLASALRGHTISGFDINPVAWTIARQTLNPIDEQTFVNSFEEIQSKVMEPILRLFKTENAAGETCDTITAFHVRTVQDPFGHQLELHHNYLIARNRRANWAIYYCPECSLVFQAEPNPTVLCPGCEEFLDWEKGTIRKGVVTCDICETAYHLKDLYTDEPNSPKFKLIAVESFSSTSGRHYHSPGEVDLRNISLASSMVEKHRLALEMLGNPIPAHRRDQRPISHGFHYYGQLFTDRQLIGLSLIVDAITEIDDLDARVALALTLSDTAGNNNLMCRYAADWRKLTPAFGLHAFDMVTRPVEGNVWGTQLGRGSFKNCFRKSRKAYSAIESAFIGRKKETPRLSFTALQCAPAQSLSTLEFLGADVVLTDPPYFDNLDYAELSDFYYQWLRECLGTDRPFGPTHCIFDDDLAFIASNGSNSNGYADQLGKCFSTIVEHLKTDGIFAFSFHHKKKVAWEALSSALLNAGLVVENLRFVRSELENGFHSNTGNIKIDAIFFCRLMPQSSCSKTPKFEQGTTDLFNLDTVREVDLTCAEQAMATAISTYDNALNFQTCLAMASNRLLEHCRSITIATQS